MRPAICIKTSVLLASSKDFFKRKKENSSRESKNFSAALETETA
jgi:hypothetical protein